ncbi:hypothetical protein DUNSADRAFT_16568 [Dunaliella salina]|uniref:Encoded protein n=1 Tax=Dunaliella salina TaxID=3046 RepID=A0ABQ7H0T9_DUNSA|nr:hypothetical protein DUNSADRAFT_16568 [Dunaliella salina]|eukprot:KAF5840477.1 hypothetical protein DUNSADRAFT_16568 [Dunaliella salina]
MFCRCFLSTALMISYKLRRDPLCYALKVVSSALYQGVRNVAEAWWTEVTHCMVGSHLVDTCATLKPMPPFLFRFKLKYDVKRRFIDVLALSCRHLFSEDAEEKGWQGR